MACSVKISVMIFQYNTAIKILMVFNDHMILFIQVKSSITQSKFYSIYTSTVC